MSASEWQGEAEAFEGTLPILEKYTVLRKLAAGGMASIFIAERKGSDEICVVKTLHDHLAQDSVVGNRFLREARVASELRHPNIARLTDAKSENGIFYLAMEFIAGHDLESMMFKLMEQRKMLPPELSLKVSLEVLAGLQHAHEYTDADGNHLEIVHRDLSPRNVMITYDGQVKIIDFGLARTNLGEFRTAPGMVLGTLRYMSPEQAVAEPVDRRSDLYSWSVVLYEMLSGRPLVTGSNAQEILHAVVTRMPPPLSSVNGGLPKALDAVLSKGMAKDREDRFASGEEMARALEEAAPALCRTKASKIGRFVASVFPNERVSADDLTQRSISTEGPDYEPTRAGQGLSPGELTAANVPTPMSTSVEHMAGEVSTDHGPEHYAPTNVYVAPPMYSMSATQVAAAPRSQTLLWAVALLAAASLVVVLATVGLSEVKEEPVVRVAPPPVPSDPVVIAKPLNQPKPPETPARVRPPPPRRKMVPPPPVDSSPPSRKKPVSEEKKAPVQKRYPWEARVESLMKENRDSDASNVIQFRAKALGAHGAKSCAYDAVFWGRPLDPCIKMLREAEETTP